MDRAFVMYDTWSLKGSHQAGKLEPKKSRKCTSLLKSKVYRNHVHTSLYNQIPPVEIMQAY